MTRLTLNILLMLAATVVIAACARRTTDRPTITVSISPQKFFLDRIAGDKWDVRCLLGGSDNPENYDPTINQLLGLEHSRAYLRMGQLPFERTIIDKVRANNPDLKIYDTSEGIELITGTHTDCDHDHDGHGHSHDVDPHTWTSAKNARIIATNMLDALIDIDPANKDYYIDNYNRLSATIDSLDEAFTVKLAPERGTTFLVWHPSLSYFARDYGLNQLSLSPEGKEASVTQLQSAIDSAKAADVKVLFFQKDIDSRQARVANEQIGARLVDINPLSYDWDVEMKTIADALSR